MGNGFTGEYVVMVIENGGVHGPASEHPQSNAILAGDHDE
jgi:hypothetical protein